MKIAQVYVIDAEHTLAGFKMQIRAICRFGIVNGVFNAILELFFWVVALFKKLCYNTVGYRYV